MLAVADEEGGVCLYDVRKQGPPARLKGSNHITVTISTQPKDIHNHEYLCIIVLGWIAHSNAIFDIAWACNEPKLVCNINNSKYFTTFNFLHG